VQICSECQQLRLCFVFQSTSVSSSQWWAKTEVLPDLKERVL
jgi:hypothetical protein